MYAIVINFVSFLFSPAMLSLVLKLCLGICACAVRHVGWKSSKVLPDMVSYCHQASADAGPTDFGPRLLMLEILTVRCHPVERQIGEGGTCVVGNRRQGVL